ncbi:MAG: ABC transporter ATP-binding protein [Clostridia bacterium]|nr:ABC transporter ATP-binding protein [Clostridia bacterium]
MNKKKRQRLSSIIKNNAIMLGKIAKHTPEYFILMIVEGVIWGLINSATAIFSYKLLNAVGAGCSFSYAAKIIAVMATFYLLAYAFDQWYWRIKNPLMRQKLHLSMHEEMFAKARSIDLSCFDDPEFYNDFVWAMNESDRRAVDIIEDTGKLINRIVASSTLFTLLLTVDPTVALILFASCTVTVICNLIGNKVSFAHSKESNPLYRKKGYINRVYRLSDHAKEIRISHASELLEKQYDENTQKLIECDMKYGKKYFLIFGLGFEALGTLTVFGIILYMISMLGKGLAVGSMVASVGVVFRIRWMLVDLIQRITKYPKHSLYVEKYLEFMNFDNKVKSGTEDVPEFESLELRNVSFSYEFASHPKYQYHDADHKSHTDAEANDALCNVSLKINKGEKIAIVGYNGAGKTTLIKLIMRLYDPSEGEILYNGVDIRQYDIEKYRSKIGTVFQDFKIFATSIAENVMNGEYSDEMESTVIDALEASDFTEKLSTLEDGIHTHLTREFDEKGTNLSGGESQKIAISRVFAKSFPIVIMDEPSSALDPNAEYNLNRSILERTSEKTVIFISHRLSTTRIADKIYMFEKGHLIEQGSHTELLDFGGKYAEMFELQSRKYRES